MGERVSLWKCGAPKQGSRVLAESPGWRADEVWERGGGVGVETEVVTEPHCQEGGSCRVTRRPLVTTDLRGVSGPSLAAWSLKDFDEISPGRAAQGEAASQRRPSSPGVGVRGPKLPRAAVLLGSTGSLYNIPMWAPPQRF